MGVLATFGSDGYKWLLAIHILLAVIWVGSGFAIQVFVMRAIKAGPDRVSAFSKDVEWFGTRVLVPTSLLVLVFGFLLINASDDVFSFGDGWVTFGFVVWLASFVTGAAFLGPESGRLSKLVDEKGPEDPEYQRRLRRLFWISRIELFLLILVVLDMTIKPGS